MTVAGNTYDVKVRWVGGPWVSLDPWRAPSLHVDDGGAQAVDVGLGVMSPTQNELWTHVHLKQKGNIKFSCRYNTHQ